jgi:hypothetical protein
LVLYPGYKGHRYHRDQLDRSYREYHPTLWALVDLLGQEWFRQFRRRFRHQMFHRMQQGLLNHSLAVFV